MKKVWNISKKMVPVSLEDGVTHFLRSGEYIETDSNVLNFDAILMRIDGFAAVVNKTSKSKKKS